MEETKTETGCVDCSVLRKQLSVENVARMGGEERRIQGFCGKT